MGSRAGSPNKNKEFLLKRLKDMYGNDFDPIVKMAGNCVVLQRIADGHANGMISLDVDSKVIIDASSSAKTAIDGWDKVAQYTESKLKAIELTGDLGLDLKIEEVKRTIVDPKPTNS